MKEAVDLSVFSMVMCGLLLLVPVLVANYLKIGVTRNLLISTLRMVVQLVLIGFFLGFLFELNNVFVNIAWFLVMIIAAVLSVINNSGLKIKLFVAPVFRIAGRTSLVTQRLNFLALGNSEPKINE